MKNKHIKNLLESLHSVDITIIDNEKDQFALIDNIIAVTDSLEDLIKAEKEALEKFRPKDYELLKGIEKEEATIVFNKKVNDYLEPKYEADATVKLKKLSEAAITNIIAQKKDITTAQKATIIRFLK